MPQQMPPPSIMHPSGAGQAPAAQNPKSSPQPKLTPPPRSVTVVATLDECRRVIALLSSAETVSVDCEGVALSRHGELCLVQVGTLEGDVYLFDLVSGGGELLTEGGLGGLLAGPVRKVMHDCRSDSDALWHQHGIRLDNVVDTQVAFAVSIEASGMGTPYPVGWSKLLLKTLNFVHEHKDAVKTAMTNDPEYWRRRPLSKTMIEYAAADVALLEKVYDHLTREMHPEDEIKVQTTSALYLDEYRSSPTGCMFPAASPALSPMPSPGDARAVPILPNGSLGGSFRSPAPSPPASIGSTSGESWTTAGNGEDHHPDGIAIPRQPHQQHHKLYSSHASGSAHPHFTYSAPPKRYQFQPSSTTITSGKGKRGARRSRPRSQQGESDAPFHFSPPTTDGRPSLSTMAPRRAPVTPMPPMPPRRKSSTAETSGAAAVAGLPPAVAHIMSLASAAHKVQTKTAAAPATVTTAATPNGGVSTGAHRVWIEKPRRDDSGSNKSSSAQMA